MKISIIYGTRPEFLKLKCLIDKLKTTFIINVIKVRQHTHNIDDEGYYDKVIEIDNSSDNRLSIANPLFIVSNIIHLTQFAYLFQC